MSITRPKKPVVRRYGRLVVRLDDVGVSIRGHRKQKWRRVSWPEIGWLAMTSEEKTRLFTELEGSEFMRNIGAAEASHTTLLWRDHE